MKGKKMKFSDVKPNTFFSYRKPDLGSCVYMYIRSHNKKLRKLSWLCVFSGCHCLYESLYEKDEDIGVRLRPITSKFFIRKLNESTDVSTGEKYTENKKSFTIIKEKR